MRLKVDFLFFILLIIRVISLHFGVLLAEVDPDLLDILAILQVLDVLTEIDNLRRTNRVL